MRFRLCGATVRSGLGDSEEQTTVESSVTGRRSLGVLLLIVSGCVVLSTRTFVAFDRMRVKVVQSTIPSASGSVHVGTDELSALPQRNQPVALIARLANKGLVGGTVSIAVDGKTVCLADLPSHATRRVDCMVVLDRSDRHEIHFGGPDSAWALSYLELATHHGNTSGWLYLVILPRASSLYNAPPLLFAALAGLVNWALMCRCRSRAIPQMADGHPSCGIRFLCGRACTDSDRSVGLQLQGHCLGGDGSGVVCSIRVAAPVGRRGLAGRRPHGSAGSLGACRKASNYWGRGAGWQWTAWNV